MISGGVCCGVVKFCMVMSGVILVKYGGATCGVVRSCKLWFASIKICCSEVGRSLAASSLVLCRGVSFASILALIGWLRSCPVKSSSVLQTKLLSWRGLVWDGTVRSCPVRLCEAGLGSLLLRWRAVRLGHVRLGSVGLGKLLLWYRGVVSSPAGSSGVLFSLVRCYRGLERPGCVGRGSVGRGLALYGKLLFRRCIVLNCEVLSAVAKFCPVKHCYAKYSKLLLWRGFGNVKRGFVSCSRVLFSWLLSSCSVVKQVSVMGAAARCCSARYTSELLWFGKVAYCKQKLDFVLSGRVFLAVDRFCSVWHGVVGQAKLLLMYSLVKEGGVRLSIALYGFGNVRLHL